MDWYKPLVKANGKGMTIIFMLAGIVMVVLGVYFGFVQGKDYVKTTAVITRIVEEEDPSAENGIAQRPIVTYTAGGKEYTEKLDSWDPSYETGKEIKVKYDPADPSKVLEDSLGFTVYLLAVGAILIIIPIFYLIKNKKQMEELESRMETQQSLFEASRPTGKEKKLYFLTDLGTAKGTAHIEDENRQVVYEAACTKFSLVADSEYDFIDHRSGSHKTHLIGKTVTSSSDAFWVLDNHSIFSIDGKDIWKVLHENGIRIETGMEKLKWNYNIFRGDVLIAEAVNTNKLVHEEDAEAKGALAAVPFPGFFRIRAFDENLDAIFLVLFAIGRTDMMIYK